MNTRIIAALIACHIVPATQAMDNNGSPQSALNGFFIPQTSFVIINGVFYNDPASPEAVLARAAHVQRMQEIERQREEQRQREAEALWDVFIHQEIASRACVPLSTNIPLECDDYEQDSQYSESPSNQENPPRDT